MARHRTYVRWSDEDRETLKRVWPTGQWRDCWIALGRRYTPIAVRAQANLLGLKKDDAKRLTNRMSDALMQLAESHERIRELEARPYALLLEKAEIVVEAAQDRIRELETAVRILRDRIAQMEKMLLRTQRQEWR